MKLLFMGCLALAHSSGVAQGQIKAEAGSYEVVLDGPTHLVAQKNVSFELTVTDRSMRPNQEPIELDAKLEMPSMTGMMLERPRLEHLASGKFKLMLDFPHAGDYRLALTINHPPRPSDRVSFNLHVGADEAEDRSMTHMHMVGEFGPWSMNREGSGTSWLPESSPMFAKMLDSTGPWQAHLMGMASANYTDSEGKRAERQVYSNSMVMLMARRNAGKGILGVHLMASLDALFNGERGYPDLFQTGETAHGRPLKDRQHPHDLLAEAAVSYSAPLGGGAQGFIYAGPIGEPALGGTMFLHRPSGMEIPEAPITHHWFDSTHITFGVVTAGFIPNDRWKLDASVFNGQEPDENRYAIDPIALNSLSGRVTFNPHRDWSLSASYGYRKSPEALEPGVDQHRLTFSANHNRAFGNGDNWSSALLFGRNIKQGSNSDAWVFESTYMNGPTSYFTRFERVEKDELVDVPAGKYTINKLIAGLVRNIADRDGYQIGIGGYIGLYSFPSTLEPFYGKSPVSFGLFIRIRPGPM